ncbi:hypothetical protein I4U23_015551 [Adineta vaga]|nr:hypothetical protein I4U23_015551 [Adineta vaga]
MKGSDADAFVSYYRQVLCHQQKINNELLENILRNNHSCAFSTDRSIPLVSAKEGDYTSINDFREKVPLTTYNDYRDYLDRTVHDAAINQVVSDRIVYFALSSGTTGKAKTIPITKKLIRKFMTLARCAPSVVWRSLPYELYPSPERRSFVLLSGQQPKSFLRSANGTPMGALSQILSVFSPLPGIRLMASNFSVIALDLVERMPDFHTNAFVQLVFALAIPDLFAYIIPFAPEFIHTVKLIETYMEEMSVCIASASFNCSSLIQQKIHDQKVIIHLNQALYETLLEYGGKAYQLKRSEYIRKACMEKVLPGLLHRLWPNLIYAATTLGGSFSIYKEQVQFYCGNHVVVTNFMVYSASEGYFGTTASIHTDEYFLSPATAFFEFIREEDVHQAQPKTLLLSEIEPGHQYELVCTTDAGLIRYRMGDIIKCTRFLTRTEDLVPLPTEPKEIPRIPLISIGYRIGNLLDVIGEKTTEQNLIDTIKRTVDDWKQQQDILVNISDFTSYAELDAFPPHYVIFLELTDDQSFEILKSTVNTTFDRNLRQCNFVYDRVRDASYLSCLKCNFVRNGTFSTFLHEKLLTDHISPIQVKPHRLLKNEQHIQYFHEHRLI